MKQAAPYIGWSALAFGFTALVLYMISPHLAVWTNTLAIIAVANGLFFVLADWAKLKKSLKSRTSLYGMNASILVLVFLGILIFINILSYRHKYSFDLTESKFYTLAPQSQKIAGNLPRNIKVTAFFSSEEPGKGEFKRLMDGYMNLTDKIELDFVDPDKNPAIIQQYGVTTYGTVILESGKQVAKVKNTSEENITNALLKVSQDRQKTIYFLEGHGEKRIDDAGKQGYSQAKASLIKDNFKVEKLLLLQTGSVPEAADLLVVNGPTKPLQESELQAIESYLNRGGAVFILLDPQTHVGLDPLLKRWGIQVQDDLVVDPMAKMFGSDYTTPIVSIIKPHGTTKDFTLQTIFPLLRSVRALSQPGLEATEVLFAGTDSWAETQYRTGGKVRYTEGQDLKGPVPVVVAVTKTLPGAAKKSNDTPLGDPAGGESADGNRSDSVLRSKTIDDDTKRQPFASPARGGDPAGGESAGGNPANSKNSGSSLKANLVVVGDSDFATNNFFNLYGNGDFFLNIASWLLAEENLIAIRPKQRKFSPMPLTQGQGNFAFVVGVGVIPSLMMLAGFRVWWKRRSL